MIIPECVVRVQKSKLLFTDAQDQFLATFVNVLFVVVLRLGHVQQIGGQALDHTLAVQSEVKVAKDEVGHGRVFGHSLVGNSIESVAQCPFAVIDVDGGDSFHGLEVAGIMEEVNVDEVHNDLRGEFPTCPQIAFT